MRRALLSLLVALSAASSFAASDTVLEALPTKNNGPYATAGDVLEVGFLTRRLGELPRPVRLGLALQTYRPFDLLGPASGNASWAPLAVLEYAFADKTLRPSILLRAGYLFARRTFAQWNVVDDDDGLTVQPGFAIDLFRARLHVALRWRVLGFQALAGPMLHSNLAIDL